MLMIFVGYPGAGKTALMTYLGVGAAMAARVVLTANYPINVPDGMPFELLKSASALVGLSGGGVLLVDEVDLWGMDARAWSSKENREIAAFIKLCRHKGYSVLMTTQSLRRLDVRQRELLSYVVLCDAARVDGTIRQFHGLVFSALTGQECNRFSVDASALFALDLYDPYYWGSWGG